MDLLIFLLQTVPVISHVCLRQKPIFSEMYIVCREIALEMWHSINDVGAASRDEMIAAAHIKICRGNLLLSVAAVLILQCTDRGAYFSQSAVSFQSR